MDNLQETDIKVIICHPLQEWSFPFIVISQEKMSSSPSEYQMDNKGCHFLENGNTKEKWDLEQKDCHKKKYWSNIFHVHITDEVISHLQGDTND